VTDAALQSESVNAEATPEKLDGWITGKSDRTRAAAKWTLGRFPNSAS